MQHDWREAKASASSSGLNVLCALCEHSGNCCGKAAEVSPNPSRTLQPLHGLCSAGGGHAGASTIPARRGFQCGLPCGPNPPCLTAGTGGPLCCPHRAQAGSSHDPTQSRARAEAGRHAGGHGAPRGGGEALQHCQAGATAGGSLLLFIVQLLCMESSNEGCLAEG